jgi:hypothetical protein
MRFDAAFTALVSSASLMGYAYAEEPEIKPDAASAIERPTFTVRYPIPQFPPLTFLIVCL